MAKNNSKASIIKPTYILTLYGQELVYNDSGINKRLEWKSYRLAKKFLMTNDFLIDGKVLNTNDIAIVDYRKCLEN